MTISEKPRWLRDLMRFLPLKSQFILSGNIKDLQLYRQGDGLLGVHRLSTVLDIELKKQGYQEVIHYNPAFGFSLPFSSLSAEEQVNQLISYGVANNESTRFSVDEFSRALEVISHYNGGPIALIADFASQLLVNQDGLSKAEHNAFTRALVGSQTASPKPFSSPPKPYFNSVIWLVDKEGDLPDWFIVENPRVRHIPISQPNQYTRRLLIDSLINSLPELSQVQDRTALANQFCDQTEGLLLLDIKAIVDLARTENIPASDIANAVRHYKVGVTEDPWKNIDRSKIANGDEFIKHRVKGQDHAITHVLDIAKRAITGVGSSKRGTRPRGVVFLAGPTGVGKTELAKTLTSLLFGDESAYIRFDMSEFSAEHSDQRLIGAPPGYVGYNVGGELTNAIREKPFSIVLFDEIEKAHPRILDKFLQVLDDGRLTSGRGDEVYFSESLIVFTSNLGVYKALPDGSREPNVTPNDDILHVTSAIKSEIERHFNLELNRPELLNRIGDNIIVFDFIRKEVAQEIFKSMLESTLIDINEQLAIELEIDPEVSVRLERLCIENLSHGGRGIRNKMEQHFINPLSRALFDANITNKQKVFVVSIMVDRQTSLGLR